jgi:hypothetical protein
LEAIQLPRRRLYDMPLYKRADSATATYVQAPKVPDGLILYVVTGALEDESGDCDSIAFGKMVGSRFEALEEALAPSGGLRYELDKTHHFLPGELPTWRIEGATVNDELRGYVEGFFEEVSDG